MQWSVSRTIPIWLRYFYRRGLLPWSVIPYLQWCCSRLYMTKWLLDEWYHPVFPSQTEIWPNCCTASTNIFVFPHSPSRLTAHIPYQLEENKVNFIESSNFFLLLQGPILRLAYGLKMPLLSVATLAGLWLQSSVCNKDQYTYEVNKEMNKVSNNNLIFQK